jgi:hypothetical protein
MHTQSQVVLTSFISHTVHLEPNHQNPNFRIRKTAGAQKLSLALRTRPKELRRIFAKADVDSDGGLDFNEFVELCQVRDECSHSRVVVREALQALRSQAGVRVLALRCAHRDGKMSCFICVSLKPNQMSWKYDSIQSVNKRQVQCVAFSLRWWPSMPSMQTCGHA